MARTRTCLHFLSSFLKYLFDKAETRYEGRFRVKGDHLSAGSLPTAAIASARPAIARSQGLHVSLPPRWQGPKQLGHHTLSSQLL